jgi:hypothetical protein
MDLRSKHLIFDDPARKHGKVIEKNGGASQDRTDDLIVANDALSQLSYSPMQWRVLSDFISRPLFSPTAIAIGPIECRNGCLRWPLDRPPA